MVYKPATGGARIEIA